MNIWLVNSGEPTSFNDPHQRRMRMGQICEALLSAGDEVTFWTSSFIHTEKRHATGHGVVEIQPNLTVVRLRSPGYQGHVSFARLLDQMCLAKDFAALAGIFIKPDLILCSYPTIELAFEAVKFGRRFGIPVIVDVRDMWPDLFAWVLPSPLRPLANLALWPYYYKARIALKRATAVCGVTDSFVDWAIARAGRARGPNDHSFHFCYEEPSFTSAEQTAASEFWKRQGVISEGPPVILFIGSLNRTFDLLPIITCARLFSSSSSAPLFVLCGKGDMEDAYREAAKGIPNVVLPGWVNREQISVILRMATVAIGPLPDRPDFRITINNKFVEYLSGSLPILVSPPGCFAAELVTANDCGMEFALNDPQQLAQTISTLIKDPQRLVRWRGNARKLFEKNFRAEEILSKWVEYLHSMGKMANGSPRGITRSNQRA